MNLPSSSDSITQRGGTDGKKPVQSGNNLMDEQGIAQAAVSSTSNQPTPTKPGGGSLGTIAPEGKAEEENDGKPADRREQLEAPVRDEEARLRKALAERDMDEILELIDEGVLAADFERLRPRKSGINTRLSHKGFFTTTLLHIAAERGNNDLVELLLQEGPKDPKFDIDATDGAGKTALHIAAEKEKPDIIEMLIKNGAEKKARDERGWTPLHYAAIGSDAKLASLLLQEKLSKPAGPTRPPGGNSFALIASALKKAVHSPTTSAELLKQRDNTGKTALHRAVMYKRESMVKVLLESKDQVKSFANLEDKKGRTALFLAAEEGTMEIAKALLGANVDIRAADLFVALKNHHTEMAELLVERLRDNKQAIHVLEDNEGRSALHWAAESGEVPIVELVLETVPGEYMQKEIEQPIIAQEQKIERIVEQYVNRKAKNGLTALDMATAQGHLRIVEMLIEHGANPLNRGNDNLAVLDRALFSGEQEVTESILQAVQKKQRGPEPESANMKTPETLAEGEVERVGKVDPGASTEVTTEKSDRVGIAQRKTRKNSWRPGSWRAR